MFSLYIIFIILYCFRNKSSCLEMFCFVRSLIYWFADCIVQPEDWYIRIYFSFIVAKKHWESVVIEGIRGSRCVYCSYLTTNIGNMKAHFKDRHDPNPLLFGCPHCPHKCKQKNNLKKHIISKHFSGLWRAGWPMVGFNKNSYRDMEVYSVSLSSGVPTGVSFFSFFLISPRYITLLGPLGCDSK